MKNYRKIYSAPSKHGQIAKDCVNFQWTGTFEGTCDLKEICCVLQGLECKKKIKGEYPAR